MRYVLLNNDIKMPMVGLGTQNRKPVEVYGAVRWALKLGYKYFDCAYINHNEEAIGQALNDAMQEEGFQREDLFITSKLWNTYHKPEDVVTAYQETLERLQLDYLDLFLMHWPIAQRKDFLLPSSEDAMISLNELPIAETWQALEEIYADGEVKAIGVANFGVERLTKLMMTSNVNPMVNLVESHPYLPQAELYNFCTKNQIAMAAYYPLEKTSMLTDETINRIADKNNLLPEQVISAWNLQRGVPILPNALNEQELKDNLAVLNVTLDAEDMSYLGNLDKRERFVSGEDFKVGPYYETDIFA